MSAPITLYTMPTPNGHKVSILLEELKAAYPGFDYDWQRIDIGKANQQKEPWFLAVRLELCSCVPSLTCPCRSTQTEGSPR